MRLRIEPTAKRELREAAQYDGRLNPILGQSFFKAAEETIRQTVIAVMHQRRRSGYWMNRFEG